GIVVLVRRRHAARTSRVARADRWREAAAENFGVALANADVTEGAVAEYIEVPVQLHELGRVVFLHAELVAWVRNVRQTPVAILVHAIAVEADDAAERIQVRREERRRRAGRQAQALAELIHAAELR